MQQSCIISQRKTVSFEAVAVIAVLLFWGFVCVNLRDLRETLGLICANRLSPLACYSPADSADYAEEYSKLYYHAEKDRLDYSRYWDSSM